MPSWKASYKKAPRAVLGGLALLEQREHLEPQMLEAGLVQTLEQRELAVPLASGEAMSSSLPKQLLVQELLSAKERMAALGTLGLLGIASQETQDITLADTIQAATLQAIIQEVTLQAIIQVVTIRQGTFIILRTIRLATVNTIQAGHVLPITQGITTRVTNIRILETHTLEIHSIIHTLEIHSIIHTLEIRTQETHSTTRHMLEEQQIQGMQEIQGM